MGSTAMNLQVESKLGRQSPGGRRDTQEPLWNVAFSSGRREKARTRNENS